MLATAVTTSAVAVGVSQDLVANCDDGHTWEDSYVVKEASCLNDGILLQECSVCGEKQEVAIPALGHDMAVIPGSALKPNCTENGAEASKKCTREGCEFTIEGDVIDALGHEYGAFTSNGNGTHSKVCANDDSHVVTENCAGGTATCTAKAICSVCDEAYGEFADHVYDQEVANADTIATEATCTAKATYFKSCVCGAKGTETFESGEKLAHVYAIETISAETLKTPADCSHDAVYYLSCECGAYGDDAYTFVAEGTMGDHNFLNTTVKDATTLVSEATCTEHAIYKYTCTGCDAIGTETYEGEILDHVMTHHDAVIATCQAGGNVEYWACSTCSKNYDAEQGGTVIEDVNTAIDANNHVSVETTKEAQDSTCTVAGWTKEEKCTACGVVVTESEPLEKAAHVGSTTEVNGCANCDHVFTVAEIVEMAQGLASGEKLTGRFELTGAITYIKEISTYYKNATVEIMVENGDNDQKFNGYRLAGEGYDVLVVGDTITIEGAIENYGGTLQFNGTTVGNCVLVSSLHSVTTETAENGSVSVNVNEQVVRGTEVIVTVTPDAGYKVAAVKVNGINIEAVEGVYKFNVEKTTIVEAIFVEEGSSVVLPYEYEFTAQQYKANETKTLNGVDWTLAGDGNYWGYDSQYGKGQQFGSGSAPYTSMTLTSSSFDNVAKVIINTSGAKSTNAKLIVKVNGVQVGDAISLTKDASEYTFTLPAITTGAVEFSYTQTSAKAIYIKEIQVHFGEAVPCTHEDTEITKTAKDATCTEPGWTEEITCVSCGEVVTASTPIDVDTINGHDYVAGTPVAPTCTADGYTTYTCTICSDSYNEAGESKLGHSETNVSYVVNAEDDTKHDKICGECSQVIETLGHDYVAGTPVAPTCTEDGYTPYTCDDCEHTYNEAGESKLGHSETNVTYRVNTEDSTKHDKVCGVCLQVVETSAHVDTNPVDNKCDFCEITICEHEWGAWTSNGDNTHTRKCTKDESHTETVDCAGGEATCTEKAVCADCGTAYGEANGHDFPETWDSIGNDKHAHTCKNCTETEEEPCAGGAATCVDKAVCDKCLTAYGEFANHEYGELNEKVDATCSKEGMEEHYFCDVCDTYFDAEKNETTEVALTIAINAENHSGIVTLGAKAATCTETGLTEGKYCEDCGTTITAQDTVDALGHSMTYHAAVDATCATAGNVEYWACANCSKNFDAEEDGEEIANVTIAALGHKYVNGECSVCHAIKQNKDVATFKFGTDGSAAKDGSSATSYSEKSGSYTLTLSSMSNMYTGAYDDKGNATIKAGTGSKLGSFAFTVPQDITSVVICIAKYNKDTTKVVINGKTYTLTKTEANGEYDEIIVDTTSTKTVTVAAASASNQRYMVNTIVFYAQTECDHANTLSENVVAPTCTEDGYTQYTCSKCAHTWKIAGESALGHEYGELVEKVDATCSATGKDAHYFCDVCETYFDAEKNETTEVALTIAINPENHSGLVTLEAKAATCTSTGLTEGKYCEDCETTIKAQEETNMLDHEDEDGNNACDECGATMCDHANIQSNVVDPTCTEDGYTQHTCDCGYNYKDTFVDALGHTAGEVVVENKKDATCTTAGSYDNVIYCTVDTCKEELSRETVTVNATGHSETEFTYEVNAKDTSKHDKKCADCGAVVATEAHVDSDSNSTCDLCNATVSAEKEYTYGLASNFSKYNSGWSGSYASKTIDSSKLGTDLPTATITMSRVSKQTGTITDKPVLGVNNSTEYVTVEVEDKTITAVTFNLQQWTTKTFNDIHIEYYNGSSWVSCSNTITTPANISNNNTALPAGVKKVRLSVKTTATKNTQVGIGDIILTLK